MEIKETSITATLVDSQPGDGTRYRYLAVPETLDCMRFMAFNSELKYPVYLNRWHIEEDIGEPTQTQIQLGQEKGCNPWTIRECVRFYREWAKARTRS